MATEGISSSTPVSAPPRANTANRAQEFRAEQQRVQNEQAQRESQASQAAEREARQREPVVNTQGQTTGRLVNEKA
ncbi:hypothetical protein [Rhodoferax sp. BAB1]|uniref:hypothetical protein n=1 Tax=Rhodoferax sp. BAB1 TaxID=2741720 RepID=UPI00157727DE|nr:hypothetical protein [Rhodoferax sp. BAB1]QKO21924.1 hypothetical protein HTY51_08485 [Rhodoferax sp. BAB1]